MENKENNNKIVFSCYRTILSNMNHEGCLTTGEWKFEFVGFDNHIRLSKQTNELAIIRPFSISSNVNEKIASRTIISLLNGNNENMDLLEGPF